MDCNNLEDIASYIVEVYPDSCLARNCKDHFYYEEELMEECEKFFYYDKLNWCGCGDPEIAKRCIRDFLNIIDRYYKVQDFDKAFEQKKIDMKNRFGVETIYDNELLLCLAYALDAAGLTTHGSGISGAWLTDEGKMFLFLLKNNKELDNGESV